MQTGQTPYLPQMRGDPPRTKTIFVRVPRPKICKGQLGEGSPPRGWNRKSAPPPKFLNPIFSKKRSGTYVQNFRDERGCQCLSTAGAVFTFNNQKLCDNKKQKFSLWGAWPPNLTPYLHVRRNLSRPLRGARDPEKISEIAWAVAEKIEFEKINLAPPSGQTGSDSRHMTICAESYPQGLESLETWIL